MNTFVTEKYKGIINKIINMFVNLYIFEDSTDEEKILFKLNSLISNLEKYTEVQILESISGIISELHDEHTILKIKEIPEFYYPICLNWQGNEIIIIDNEGKQCPVKRINDKSIEEVIDLYYKQGKYSIESMFKLMILKDIIFAKNTFSNNKLKVDYIKNENICTINVNRKKFDYLMNVKEIDNIRRKDNFFEIRKISKEVIYLKITTFEKKNISSDIEICLNDAEEFESIIVDIRNNPGGYIKEAKKFLSLFIDETIILPYKILKKKGNSYYSLEQKVIGKGIYKNKNIIVLVNEFTMSSSEYIVALGVKKFIKSGILIGNKTAGILDQALIVPLNEKLDLQLTVSKYIELDNSLRTGIEPDIYMKKINVENLTDFFKIAI